MADLLADPAPTEGDGEPTEADVDAGRVRSYLGMSVARVGPRAHGILTGTFLVLLVSGYTSSAFGITFAVTAHRLLYWITLPVIGRLSDRSDTRLGRRVPFMAGGMALLAVCTWLYASASSYWVLVALLVLARQGSIVSTITGHIAVAEIFGRSRWVKAVTAVFVTGLLVSLTVRGTVVATWVDDDPSTWATTFRVGAVWMAVAALATLLFVRESPDARDAPQPAVPDTWRDHLHDFDQVRNGRRLAVGIGLIVLGLSATGRLFPVYATEALGASASDLALLPLMVVPVQVVAVWAGLRLSGQVPARRLVVGAGVVSVALTAAHFVITSLWQYVLLGGLLAVPFSAAAVVIVPMVAQMLPRSGRIGERLGLIVAPVTVGGVVGAYLSAGLVDTFDEIRLIWVVPTLVAAGWAITMTKLEMLHPDEHPNLGAQLRRAMAVTAEGERGRLFRGQVASDDVDPTVGLGVVQTVTDPYVPTIDLLDEEERLVEWTRRLLRLGVASPTRREELLDAVDEDVVLVRGDGTDVVGRRAVVAEVDRLHGDWGHPVLVDDAGARAAADGAERVTADRRVDGGRQRIAVTFHGERIRRVELTDRPGPHREPIPVDLTSATARSRRDRRTFTAVSRHLLGPLLRRGRDPERRSADAARRLRRVVDRLGGVYARFGATVAASPDRVGPTVAAAFDGVVDDGPALPVRALARIVAAEAGADAAQGLERIDPEPTRCTATTVVHAGRTLGGQAVEVTVVRPEVHADASVDLTALVWIAAMLFPRGGTAGGMRGLVRDLRADLAVELDLRNAADADPEGVVTELSGRHVLVRAIAD